MGRPTDPPAFPVVDEEPTVGKTFRSFRMSDWRNLAVATGVSIPFGYMAGRPVVMIPAMYTCAGLGLFGGLMLGMQASFARLTGYAENSVEVAKMQANGLSTKKISE